MATEPCLLFDRDTEHDTNVTVVVKKSRRLPPKRKTMPYGYSAAVAEFRGTMLVALSTGNTVNPRALWLGIIDRAEFVGDIPRHTAETWRREAAPKSVIVL